MGAMVSLTRPTPTRSSDPLTALCQRSQNAGALPLLTWYHGADRGELSARTLLTWVTKSVYLLDSEGVEPGGVSRLSVCGARPGHWTSCVWLLASWWAGLRVDLTGQEEAALEVIGPDVAPVNSPDVLIQCSLAPLATACETLVSGAIDNADVLAAPDDLVAARPAAANAVWLTGRQEWTGEQRPSAAKPTSFALSRSDSSRWQRTRSHHPYQLSPGWRVVSPRRVHRRPGHHRSPGGCCRRMRSVVCAIA